MRGPWRERRSLVRRCGLRRGGWARTCGRELLDHVILLGEGHLRRLLAEYVAYNYSGDGVHTRLGDSHEGRPIESRPSPTVSPVGVPLVGGLHHRYVWAEAA
jgi:hypothetical protein